MKRVLPLCLLIAAELAYAAKPPPPRKRELTQNDGEFALSGLVPMAHKAIAVPPEDKINPCDFNPSKLADTMELKINTAIKGKTLKQILKEPEVIRAALVLDALRIAGTDNLAELMTKGPKYQAFANWFVKNRQALTLYAGAGIVPANTAEGWRVMADIWARDKNASDIDVRLMTGIAACWAAGPQSKKLLYHETLPPGDNRSNPVWRYYFFKQSEQEGRLHKNYPNLRPWEIRFIAGNSWDDESLYWLQQRVNLPPDRYGDACWTAAYCDLSKFGMTVQGPLYYVQAPADMGEGQRTVTMGGVCGSLSHVGCHAAAAHGIPAYTVGQPGHCAYGFRLERGKWLGGFGGPDGGPHNWIFPGCAPTALRLMEEAFKDDKRVDHCVILLALAHAGVEEAWPLVAKAWAHNWYVQREYLERIQGNTKALITHAMMLTKSYRGHGFALMDVLGPYLDKIEGAMKPEQKLAWRFQIHRRIAETPPSWKVKEFPDIIKRHFDGLNDADSAELLGKLFKLYVSAVNTQSFGVLLEWSIQNYVATGKDEVFASAFKAAAEAPVKESSDDKKTVAQTFAAAIIAAEKAGSGLAVNALSDLAEKKGLADGYDPKRGPITVPSGARLISDGGLLTLSTTSNWDRPICHRNVIRDAPGAFHTDKEYTPYALVKLPKAERVSDIVIVKNSGNGYRSKHLKVSRSVDGATFFTIAENENTPDEWRIKLDRAEPAGWIKVEQIQNGQEVMHLRNILIYAPGGAE